MRRVSQGFSLIELVVAMVILIILALLAVPNFLEYIDRARVKGAADDVATLVATARAEAVKLGRDVTVSAGSGGAWCVGANEAETPDENEPIVSSAPCVCSSGSCVVDGRQRVVTADAFGGVTAVSAFTDFTIDARLGTLVGAAAPTMTLQSPASTFRVQLSVSPLGLVRTCTPAASPQIPGYPTC